MTMEYNKIGDWAIGYLEALSTGNSVSKQQLGKMINRIQEMISEIECRNAANVLIAEINDDDEF
jgi:hypothetical protein